MRSSMGRMDRDHAIPMNRKHCGLHLYDNVLPATKEANQRKAGQHYHAAAEEAGEVNRWRNRLHLTHREYTERLFSDGIAKGWLVD